MLQISHANKMLWCFDNPYYAQGCYQSHTTQAPKPVAKFYTTLKSKPYDAQICKLTCAGTKNSPNDKPYHNIPH